MNLANHPPQGTPLPPAPGMPVPGMPVPGMPMPGAPAPGAIQQFGQGGPAGNVTSTSINLEDQIVVVGYIATQSNYLKPEVIYERDAKSVYNKFYKEQSELANDDPNKVVSVKKAIKPDGTEDAEKEVKLDEKYSVVRFRTFCSKAWDDMKAKNYCQVVMAEAKAAYLVIKAIIPEGADHETRSTLTSKLNANSVYRSGKNSTFIVNEKQAIQFIGSSGIRAIQVYNDIDAVGTKEGPDGYVIVDSRTIETGKKAGEVQYRLKFAKISKEADDFQQAYMMSYPREVIKNYAVNQDMTERRGTVCSTDENIINIKTFQKVFGEDISPSKEYGVQIKFNKNEKRFQGHADPAAAAKEAKQKTFIEPGKPGWDKYVALGLDEKAVTQFRKYSASTSTGTKPVDVAELLGKSFKAAQSFVQKED